MAKVSGLGGTVTVADAGGTVRSIQNDITNWTLSTPRAVQDVTGLDKFANERILLLADVSMTLNGVFNPTASTSSHAVFATVTSTSVTRATSTLPVGGTSPVLNGNYMYTDYQLTRAATGELTWQAPGVLSDGNVPTWG